MLLLYTPIGYFARGFKKFFPDARWRGGLGGLEIHGNPLAGWGKLWYDYSVEVCKKGSAYRGSGKKWYSEDAVWTFFRSLPC